MFCKKVVWNEVVLLWSKMDCWTNMLSVQISQRKFAFWGFFTPKYHHNTYFQHGGTFYWSTIFKWQLSSNQAQYNLKSSTTEWQLCCWGCGHIDMLYPHSSSRYTERELTSRILTYNHTIPLIIWLCIFKTTLASEFLTNCELRDVIRFLSGKMLNWLTLFIGPLEWRNDYQL